MSKFVLTVFERSIDDAVAVIRNASTDIHAFEIRLDQLHTSITDLRPLREATRGELILTRRSSDVPHPFTRAEIQQALEIGFDFVDVELSGDLCPETLLDLGERAILSHHDFSGTPELDSLYRRMRAFPAQKRKIAVTPSSFADNESLLTLAGVANDPNLTLIGMGSRGLYSRILAPFFASELIFVAPDERSVAAPGQLTLHRAREVYGDPENLSTPGALFAVVGNPVSHSRSPEIHNRCFRECAIPSAYSMIEVERFSEIGEVMRHESAFAPAGVSITAPFKEEAWEFARSVGAKATARATQCRAINTLVRVEDEFFADNTDVVAFAKGLERANTNAGVALIGAGGAARAALLALLDRGARPTIYNRTSAHAERLASEFGAAAAPLSALSHFRGEVVINALPGDVEMEFPLRRGGLYLDVSYGDSAAERAQRARQAGMEVFDGMDFLAAQAVPQFELFSRAAQTRRGVAR